MTKEPVQLGEIIIIIAQKGSSEQMDHGTNQHTDIVIQKAADMVVII